MGFRELEIAHAHTGHEKSTARTKIYMGEPCQFQSIPAFNQQLASCRFIPQQTSPSGFFCQVDPPSNTLSSKFLSANCIERIPLSMSHQAYSIEHIPLSIFHRQYSIIEPTVGSLVEIKQKTCTYPIVTTTKDK